MYLTTTVRAATEADFLYIARLEEQFGEESFSKSLIKKYLKSDSLFLLIECEGQVAGYSLVLQRKKSKVGRLYSICIDRAFHKLGLGEVLLNCTETYCALRGIETVKLECSKSNASALRLYLKSGYDAFGLTPNYYADGTTAVLMSKRVTKE